MTPLYKPQAWPCKKLCNVKVHETGSCAILRVGARRVHLQEYVQTNGIPENMREAVGLFSGAVAALQESLPPGSYHSRLSPASLQIDGNPAAGRLSLADRDMIRPDMNAPGGRPVWPFCAPEQTDLVDEPVGVASNIYTLGVIGSYLCGSRPRMLGLSGIELAEAIVRDPIEPELGDGLGTGSGPAGDPC